MKNKKKTIIIIVICTVILILAAVITVTSNRAKHSKAVTTKATTVTTTEEPTTILLSDVWENGYHASKFHTKQIIGQIVSEDLNVNCNLVYDTTSECLLLGAGLHKCSSLPGLKTPQTFSSTCPIIAGHCQIDFSGFVAIDPAVTELPEGITITLKMPYGDYVYEVKSVEIMKATDFNFADYRASTGNFDGETAIFYTCYPFGKVDYVKQDRMFLFCELIEGYEVIDDAASSEEEESESLANIE